MFESFHIYDKIKGPTQKLAPTDWPSENGLIKLNAAAATN